MSGRLERFVRANGARCVVVLALAVGLTGMFATAGADAAPVPTWTAACGDPAVNLDPAVCERLNYVAAELSAIDDSTATLVTAGGSSTVALSGDALQALVDVRQATFYLVGLVAALIFTFTFWRTFGTRS